MKRLCTLVLAILALTTTASADTRYRVPRTKDGHVDWAKVNSRFIAMTDGPLTVAPNLRVRTDENGYLRISKGTSGVTDGPLTAFGNIRIRTDENGYLRVSCDDCGGAPAGADTQVQFNNAGAFGGDADLTFSGDTLTVTKVVVPTVYGSAAANGDIAIEGTSDPTKTSSDVLLQPTAGRVYIGPYEAPIDTGASLGIFHAVTASMFIRDTVNNVEFGAYTSGGASAIGTASNHGWSLMTNNANKWTVQSIGSMTSAGVTLANLGTPANGTFAFCSDCNIATPCTGSGAGAWAFRNGGAWNCPF